tara:strand:- start:55 stop:594 length:540 start_codon:yes stop_codon:yes gene_type:complete
MVKVPSMTGYATAGMPFGFDPMAEAYAEAIKAGVNPLDPMNKKPKPPKQEVLPKGLVATENPGVYNTTDGKPVLKQGDKFVVIDNFGGFLGAPTTMVAYEEPPPDEAELTASADTALATATGTDNLCLLTSKHLIIKWQDLEIKKERVVGQAKLLEDLLGKDAHCYALYHVQGHTFNEK